MTDTEPTENTEQATHWTREVSRLFESMKRPERRSVLLYLRESDIDSVGTDELSEHVSNQLDEDEATVQRSLRQWHLPKLADLEYIHYDRERDLVRGRGSTNELLDQFSE